MLSACPYADEAALGMDVEDEDASASAEAGPSGGAARGGTAKKPRTRARTVGKRNRAAKGGTHCHSASVSSRTPQLPWSILPFPR